MFTAIRSRLIVREHLCLSGFVLVVSRIEISERLSVGITDDIAAGDRRARVQGSGVVILPYL
jgi:hypothetical protein